MTEPVRPQDMRASDADRNLVQDQLRRAHELGQLDLNEFDERVRTTWAARTRGELAQLIADLPAPPPPRPAARRGRVFARTPGGVAMQVLAIIWVALTVLNVTVWGIVTLTFGEAVYPWWLWVAGPPGAVLATLYALGIGRPRRDR